MSSSVALRRLIAAGLHAIFALPMGSFLLFIIFVLASEFNPENHNILGLIIVSFLFELPMIIILPIILSIAWQLTKKIHLIGGLGGLFGILLIGHLCATIDRAIAAWNGRVPNHLLLIKFLADI